MAGDFTGHLSLGIIDDASIAGQSTASPRRLCIWNTLSRR